jgi:LysM repeat protein
VQPGETLTGIGARYGVAPLRIAARNRVADPDFILAGARLVIPAVR